MTLGSQFDIDFLKDRPNSHFLYQHPEDNNPEEFEGDTVRLYRGQSGDDDTLGIHWTRNPNMAWRRTSGEADTHTIHSAVAHRDDIIPRTEWFGKGVSRQGDDTWIPTQWGLDVEEEVRLRPGAVLQGHAVAEGDGSDRQWRSTGRSPVVDVAPHRQYKNLAQLAVQGTPQAESLHRAQAQMPHVQPPLPFGQVELVDPVSKKSLGYVKDDALEPDSEWISVADDHTQRLSAQHGKLTVPESRDIGETVPLENLRKRLGPQFGK